MLLDTFYKEPKFKNILSKLYSFIDNYYFIIIGALFILAAIKRIIHGHGGHSWDLCILLYALASLTAYSSLRKDVKLPYFILFCIPFLLFIGYIGQHGYAIWGRMLHWQMGKSIVIDLNPIFKKIPFNDASFFRIYKPQVLTDYLRLVYANGFVLPVMVMIFRYLCSKDFINMIRSTLSGHVLQIFLITPFYLLFHLQEVWYVLGDPDGMNRHFTPMQAAGWTLNCFPSMHTSIAFAMFLLALRDKNKIFKYIFGFFCLSIIFSTMYLEIHWVIDVLAGLVLAYVTVKLVDVILDKLSNLLKEPLSKFYYKNEVKTYIEEPSKVINK